MKVNRDELILKLANNLTDGADMSSLLDCFRETQAEFLKIMADDELIQYANDILGYDVEQEGL